MQIIISTVAEAVLAHQISTLPRALEIRQDPVTSPGPGSVCHFWAKAFKLHLKYGRLSISLGPESLGGAESSTDLS